MSKKPLKKDLIKDLIKYSDKLINLDEVKDKEIINSIIKLNMDLLFSINILIKKKSYAGIEELSRCYIETFFQLIFILKDPTLIEKRALAYEYFYNKNKISLPDSDTLNTAIKNHLEEYAEMTSSDDSIKKLITDLKESPGFKEIENYLNSSKFSDIKSEIDRIKNKYNRKEIKNFYECFSSRNIVNLYEVCKYINHEHSYLLSYKLYSKKIHGIDIRRKTNPNDIVRILLDLTFDVFKIYTETFLEEEYMNTLTEFYVDIKCDYNLISSGEKEEFEKSRNEYKALKKLITKK